VLAVLLGLLFMLRIGPPHAVLFLMGMLQSGIPVGTYALVAEVSPRLKVATWFGILLTASNLGSVLGPALSGWLKDVTGSHLPGMAAMCGISVLMLAACVLVLAIRRSAPTPGSEVAEQARAE
jgi:MFS family permease